MNTPTPYENLIATKLEQMPVPDMADSIWASIELQLDADLSSDDADHTPSKNPGTGKPGFGKGFYFSLLTVVVALIILYNDNKKPLKKNSDLPSIPETTTVAPVPDSILPADKPFEKNNNGIKNMLNQKDTIANSFVPPGRISFDSLTPQSFSSPKPDSAAPLLKNKPALLPSFDSLAPPQKIKPKGVKGITNEDYKIRTDKKDSLKRGG